MKYLGKYDLPVLLKFLYEEIVETKSPQSPINIIKRNSSYMQISFMNIQLRDVLNYTTPCSLSEYLRQWQISETKSIFPHSLFKNVEAMKQCVEFPSITDFWSDLKQKTVDEKSYESAKQEFNRRNSLPKSHKDHISSMFDWLRYYNLIDVKPLTKAIATANSKFKEFFNVDASEQVP